MLDMAMINSKPRFMSASGDGMGSGAQVIIDSVSAMIGDKINNVGDDIVGLFGSLIINLMPSAIGCSSPAGPTRFGPFRSCM